MFVRQNHSCPHHNHNYQPGEDTRREMFLDAVETAILCLLSLNPSFHHWTGPIQFTDGETRSNQPLDCFRLGKMCCFVIRKHMQGNIKACAVPLQSQELISVGNAQKSLENICGWSYLQHREQTHAEQHDHTIYLSRQEFGPPGMQGTTVTDASH